MKLTLYQPWGGLGDNLQFSTLPEELAKRGDEVYISRRNTCRNPEIHDLVWACNPHVKGISDDEPNLGHPAFGYDPSLSNNIVTHWELCSGLTPTAGLPRIYLEPHRLAAYEDLVLVDVSSASIGYEPSALVKRLDEVLERFPDQPIMQVQFANHKPPHNVMLNMPTITVASLREYWNVMFSASSVVTVFSGASVLAAALLDGWRARCEFKPVVLRPRGHFKGYIFPGIEYVDV